MSGVVLVIGATMREAMKCMHRQPAGRRYRATVVGDNVRGMLIDDIVYAPGWERNQVATAAARFWWDEVVAPRMKRR